MIEVPDKWYFTESVERSSILFVHDGWIQPINYLHSGRFSWRLRWRAARGMSLSRYGYYPRGGVE